MYRYTLSTPSKQSAKMSTRILPPRHCHIYWSATRARHFARVLLNDPKRRGTYDQNIRLLNSVYGEILGRPANTDKDVRLFIQRVNPLALALACRLEKRLIISLLRGDFQKLLNRFTHSKCSCCRAIGASI